MSTQYDSFAADYAAAKTSPLRRYIETYSYQRLLGDVSGQRVLDLACGDGFYARLLRDQGAADVTGVDLSAEMIALAEAEEARQPRGIRYLVGDVAELPVLGEFDLVSAAYLLHYALDTEGLKQMAQTVASQLKPGGRLVTLTENPDQPADPEAGYTRYGFNKALAGSAEDGASITYWMIGQNGMFSFDVRYFRKETYEAVLEQAGFTDICWEPLSLSPEAPDPDHWAVYLEHPPVVGLTARKEGG